MKTLLLSILALSSVGCSDKTERDRPHTEPDLGISRPLNRSDFVSGRFVAYTLLWQVSVPGGDPIVFNPDGTIQNRRAGLVGPWKVLDDSTLVIGKRIFRHQAATKELAARMERDSVGTAFVWWIRRSGTQP